MGSQRFGWTQREEADEGQSAALFHFSSLAHSHRLPPAIRSALVCSDSVLRPCQLKTRSSLFSAVSSFVVAQHPYQTPEIIELPIQQGHKSYLEWIKSSTKGQGREKDEDEGESWSKEESMRECTQSDCGC